MPRLRTGYSFRTAVGGLDEVLDRIQEVGWPVAPITDRASTFGWVKWEKAAVKRDLRPVFGVELAVVENACEKKPTTDHWVFLAQEAVEPVNRLVFTATTQFRYQPLVTYGQAVAAEGVVRIAGHRCKLDLVEPTEDTLYGLSPASARGHVRRAVERGFRLVATSDNFFPRRGDSGFYEVVCGRGASTQTYDQHIQTDEEWIRSTRNTGLTEEQRADALALRSAVWDRCRAGLLSAEIVHPPRPASLRQMCEEGAARLGCDLTRPEYAARLDRELALIAEKAFEDYFYLVADVCQWARGNMAVGPARGSSCGSLVCYLLEITTVDPIPHGLIFERFIDTTRADLPDIDIDFSDRNRYRVFEHLEQRYGADRVARLGTVAMYKGRSALQEAGAALSVPRWKCDAVAEALVDRSSADSRATDTLEDAMTISAAGREVLEEWPEMRVAARMEGHPRHYSQHAAGAVVASEPILKFVAIDHRTNATMCDKYDAEGRLNLLKIDVLGLTQLSVIEVALEQAGLTMADLQRVPKDDQAAFDVLNRGEFSGIFQWNGNALQSLTSQIHVDRFDDVVAISALARPGPLATGGSGEWARRRASGVVPPGLHPLLDELTKETYGVIVYQEQVMRVVREMGGLSWEDTSLIRKAMSRRLGNEFFEQFALKFIAGAGENGVPPETARKVWDQINTFGSWAFNKSHAVAYGYISYWCCWLKAHHPFEFAAATLTHETDPARQIELLKEMKREGYGYVPFDAALSTDQWTAGKDAEGRKVLVGPLQNVKGIGPAAVKKILRCRELGEPISGQIAKAMENPETSLDTLTPIGDAIRRLMPDPAARNITTLPTPIADIKPSDQPYEAMIFCTPVKINPRDENEIINLTRRGFEITDGKTEFLQLRCMDDTGTVMAKVNRFNFGKIGRTIIDKGRPGKSLWALKGKVYTMGEGFLILSVSAARYIGDLEKS